MCKKLLKLCYCRWDPTKRMTPDEAFQHDWIKEGMVHRTRNHGRTQSKRPQISAEHPPQQDLYKVSAGTYICMT